MGSLFRSEEMTLCQLFLQSEAAYTCVSELGELGLVQFRDLNPDVNAFQRKFVNEVRRCDEMERKLRFLEKEIKKDGIPMLDTGDNPDAPQPREMIDLEATFEKLENEMKEVNANAEALKRNFLELTELKHILRKTQGFFEEQKTLRGLSSISKNTGGEPEQMATEDLVKHERALIGETQDTLIEQDELQLRHQATIHLGFVAGVIHRERIPAFERMLWRACRGNVFLKQTEIETPLEDPVTGEEVRKSVFIIFFQGDQLKSRVKKICEGFRATLYPCPETPAERREMAVGVMTRIEDLNTVLGQTQDHRHRVLVAAAKNIKVWFIKVRKIKAIYHTLNMFNLDVTQKCLIAECWCAVSDLDKIQLALRRGTERSGSSVPSILNRMQTKQPPPTYHRVNKFTSAFQNIIDAYGVANYREANPSPFTIITFPFLFSVMFGDLGHGLIMFLFALWMVIREKNLGAKKTDNEIWNTFFGGRYIILLMGCFSMYSGLMYNDVFAKPLNIFGSAWTPQYSAAYYAKNKLIMLEPVSSNKSDMYRGTPYYLGMDPLWQVAANKITFQNSFKMKLSVILGISQMMFGLWLSLFNHTYFKRRLNIWCEFIPELLFMTSIFVYLVILIFYKWSAYTPEMAHCAPSLLIGLINMFLLKYPDGPDDNCSVKPFYNGQQSFQTFLVVIALLCVPWMLFVKPFILRKQHKEKSASRGQAPLPVNGVVDPENPEIQHHDGAARPIEEEEEEAMLAMKYHHGFHRQHGQLPQLPKNLSGGAHLSVNSGDIVDERGEVTHHDGNIKQPEDEVEEEFDFADVFIHQCIHTIEYCLGCVSNTASYLRLWALSLAHAELSEVLWTMVMRIGLGMNGWIGTPVLVAIFSAWAVLTVAILLLMEGLSAFLHTLRLHWVEFQNKFYIGAGYKFLPFSFESIMDLHGPEDIS